MALSATYSSAHQFIVSGDQTNVFVGGRAFRADCGLDGTKIGYVAKSVYSAPDTTVDLVENDSDDLTSNLVTIEVSNLKPNTTAVGNLPFEIQVMARGIRRFVFPVFTAAGTLTITPGFLHLFDGTREKILTVESSFTVAISSLTNNVWHYIYVSAPVNHGIVITSSDIVVSETAPTYNEIYKGWYDGSYNRCIGFFKSNASGTMRFFKTDGFYYRFNNGTTKVNTSSTGWTNITLDLPVFADIYLIGELIGNQTAEVDSSADCYLRTWTTGESSAPLSRLSRDGPSTGVQQRYCSFSVMVAISSSKNVMLYTGGVAMTHAWNCNGIFLPRGLQCT